MTPLCDIWILHDDRVFPCVCVCVCQNTYTNAEKLLEAADQLAQSGECEEEEIYQAARDLELRMQVRHKSNRGL